MDDSARPRRPRNVDEMTRRLLEAAATEFVENGYDKAVVSNIARRAGVTTGAIYARWPHKSDVMVAALDRIFEEILPDQRIKDLGLAEMPVAEILEAWGTTLIRSDGTQDVLVQVFGSARNNPAVHARLQKYLDDQADQLARLIDRGKVESINHPEFDTVAATLLLQAIGIGTHLLMATGRDERHRPSPEDWAAVLVRLIAAFESPLHQPR